MKFNKVEIFLIGLVALSLASSTLVLSKRSPDINLKVEVICTTDGMLLSNNLSIPEYPNCKPEIKNSKEIKINSNYQMYCNATYLNVRDQPNTDSNVVGFIKYRSKLTVLGDQSSSKEGWLAINYNNDTFYVSKDFLTDNQPDIPLYSCIDYDGIEYVLSEDLQRFTYETCVLYGIVDYYEVIMAQMMHETHYIEGAVSQTNDHGLMQINERNHSWLSEKLNIPNDFDDSRNSITAGVYLMSTYLNEENLSVSQALSKYNTGETYNSSKYSKSVLNYCDRLQKIN